ncbi:hypothetical protein LG293_16185 (plasmid) [Citricoccus nitrophenolicus]
MSTPALARHRFAAAKARAKSEMRREDGAIDLPSTMTSVLVITAFLAVAAVVVFGVIPWAQNNAAKQLVSQVATSQSAYYAMSGDLDDPQYASLAQLKNPTALGTGTQAFLTQNVDPAKVNIRTWNTSSAGGAVTSVGSVVAPAATFAPKANTDAFAVSVRSDTGRVYWASSENPSPQG